LKLQRLREQEEDRSFTLHVTKGMINLVTKALNKLSTEETTMSRSISNLVKQSTRSGDEVRESKPASAFQRKPCAGVQPAMSDTTQLFNTLDTNHDGVLSPEEFAAFMGGQVNLNYGAAPAQGTVTYSAGVGAVAPQTLAYGQGAGSAAVVVGQSRASDKVVTGDVQQRGITGAQLVGRTEDAIAGMFQQAESVGAKVLQRTENAISGQVVQQAPHDVVEVGAPERVSLSKPVSAVPQGVVKFDVAEPASLGERVSAVASNVANYVREETSNIGRTESSRFRNKTFEFTEDDVVQMRVFTPLMNLVIKSTYETNEAFQAALEKRRRGLKLQRLREQEEDRSFTLHVTKGMINLVTKALNKLSTEETTMSRSISNLVKKTTRSEVEVSGWDQSRSVSAFPSKPGQKARAQGTYIGETNLHSTGEDASLTNRIEEDTEGVAMGLSFEMSFEPVNERMSFEPVSERKKTKRQETSWTEGANLTDTLFLQSRIHLLNSMVNKVCGEIRIVRTHAEIQEAVEEVIENVENENETEIYLDSVRLQQFSQLVLGVLHPDLHKDRCMDDSICQRDGVHPHAVYVHLEEYDVNASFEGPDSAELLHATSLVCRALHNTMDMSERTRPGAADSEDAQVVAFAQDSNLSARVKVFDKLIRKSLQTEHLSRQNQ